MSPTSADPVAKVHPASREMLPDDPLELHALEVPGDPGVMLRVLVEEFARMGCDREQILSLCRNPFYAGLHGLWQQFGEDGLSRRVAAILARSRPWRVSVRESPPPDQLVQLGSLGSAANDHSG
jgi:hypothetical protein